MRRLLLLLGCVVSACAHADAPKLAWTFEPGLAAPAGPWVRNTPQVQEIPPAARPTLHFAWPVRQQAVNSIFGRRQDPLHPAWESFHYGVDLEAAYGAVIRAAALGRVTTARRQQGHGRQVCLQHAGGYLTCYAHLSQVLVQEGAWVRAGGPLGLVGNSGRSTGAHLHFEVLKDGTYLDPMGVLGTTLSLD